MDKNLEQIYRVDYMGRGEHGVSEMWCIIGKSSYPSHYNLNSPFENGGGYGAVYIKSSDDKLKEDFVTARDLIENFSAKHEDVTTKKIFKVWHSHKDDYWIATTPKNFISVEDTDIVVEDLRSGYWVYLEAYSSSHAFFIGKPMLDKYPIEDWEPLELEVLQAEVGVTQKIMDKTCKTCKYYYSYSSEEYNFYRSECRFNPPTTFVYDKTFRNNCGNPEITRVTDAHWPKVSERDWCGKYIEKEITNGEI